MAAHRNDVRGEDRAIMTNRPGDVLIGRYQLVDLLSESRKGRFWRGYDTVLARPVAVHVLDADDDRAPLLMDAARASARVVDSRLLRVLDAELDGRICYVVNEWGSGTSLDLKLADEGPLPPRLAAWVVDEVAATLTVAHEAGVTHGRLNPENVLIDHNGSVRIIGFAVEAAVYGLPPDRITDDVIDLAGLLHCALTGRWAGRSDSAVPRVPTERGLHQERVLRPRQVRAGVPRALDDLVDEVLNRPHGKHAGPTSAREIHDLLSAFVGDPAGLAERLVSPLPQRPTTMDLPATEPVPVVEAREAERPEAASPDTTAETTSDIPTGAQEPTDDATATGEATAVGTPVFEDSGDVGWFNPRTDAPPPPPPAFEPPPERPLFAPEPPDGEGARRPRPAATPPAPVPPAQPPPPQPEEGGGGFWPWTAPAAADEPREVPGRGWLRLAIGIGVLVLLVLGAITAYDLGRDGGLLAGDEPTPSASPTAGADVPATVLEGLTASDLDPEGDDGAENPEQTDEAVDGDRDTAWRTATYKQNFGPGGLKSGVGLVVDLRRPSTVTEVVLDWAAEGATAQLYVTESAPTTVAGLEPVAELTSSSVHSTVPLVTPVTGRFVTIWITQLPTVSDGFRADLAEITVAGRPAG